MQIPDYYLPIMPYLVLDPAKVEGFLEFITAVLGAEEKLIVRHDDGKIMHAEFTFGKAAIMFGVAGEMWSARSCGMFVLRDDIDEVYKRAIEKGAVSLQEIDEREYGRSAGFRDLCGNDWWITKP